jgi:ribonuclease HI
MASHASYSSKRERATAQKTYHERQIRLQQATYDRKIRIINNTIGEYRIFTGNIIIQDPGLKADTRTDDDLLLDIQDQYNAGKAAVYWTDGSVCNDGLPGKVLGAGVAYRDRNKLGLWKWKSWVHELGYDTGRIADAELFGIAAALRLAVEKVNASEAGAVQRVRIFSDAMRILQDIEEGTIRNLGPAISSPWALEDIYGLTDFLVDSGVVVELVWVKGHAYSEGNIRADLAAGEASQNQLDASTGNYGWNRKQHVPAQIAEMGPDSVDEWYWRVNKAWISAGMNESDAQRFEQERKIEGCHGEEDAESEGSADMDCSE